MEVIHAGPSTNSDDINELNDEQCDCVVCDLLNEKFSNHSFTKKQAIIEGGRPTPLLKLTKGMKNFKRYFNSSAYDTCEWLAGCEKKCKLFCWPCLLFSSVERIPWNKQGYSDLNNLNKMIRKHSNSKSHLQACLDQKRFDFGAFSIEDEMDVDSQRKHNGLVRKNREVMRRLIDATCFIGEHECSIRRHDEEETSLNNKSSCIHLLNFLAKYDPLLSNHLEQSTSIAVTSDRIQNCIVNSIADVVLNRTKMEIQHARYVYMIMNETTDISNRSCLSVVLRYITREGTLQERFVGVTRVTSERSVEAVYKIVCDVLKTYECGHKLVAQSYDGAVVLARQLENLQAKVKEQFSDAVFVHCFADKLNMILIQCVSQIKECKIFFETLNRIAVFFSKSTEQTLAFDEQIKKRLPKADPINWNFSGHLVNMVYQYRNPLIDFFKMVVNEQNWDAETIMSCRGYLDLLSNDFNFNFLLIIFASILPYADALSDTQMSYADSLFTKIREFQSRVLRKMEEFDEYWQEVEQLCMDKPQKKRLRTTIAGDIQTYYRCLFGEIMKNISDQLQHRFENFGDMKFLELTNFSKKKDLPNGVFESLRKLYGNMFDIAALESQTSVLCEMPELDGSKNCAEVLTLLKQITLDTVYMEAAKLCELVLTISPTNTSVERISSVLKRIKHFVANSMEDEQLSNFAVISIENDVIKTLSQYPQFYDDVIKEFLRHENRIELIYK